MLLILYLCLLNFLKPKKAKESMLGLALFLVYARSSYSLSRLILLYSNITSEI